MIIPEGLTLEELIGAMKTELNKYTSDDTNMEMAGHLTMLEIIKRELDKKADK